MSLLKKIQQLSLVLVAMSFMFVSCDSNDPTPTPPPATQANSYFTYLGNTYPLDAGSITPDVANSNSVPDNFIVLYSSGIQLNAALDGFTGFGDGISFSIYGGNVIGNFSFDNTPSTPAVGGEFRDAEIAINMDATDTSASGTIINSGSITIVSGTNGNGYIIDASGSTSANNPYTLHYEGTLTVSNIH